MVRRISLAVAMASLGLALAGPSRGAEVSVSAAGKANPAWALSCFNPMAARQSPWLPSLRHFSQWALGGETWQAPIHWAALKVIAKPEGPDAEMAALAPLVQSLDKFPRGAFLREQILKIQTLPEMERKQVLAILEAAREAVAFEVGKALEGLAQSQLDPLPGRGAAQDVESLKAGIGKLDKLLDHAVALRAALLYEGPGLDAIFQRLSSEKAALDQSLIESLALQRAQKELALAPSSSEASGEGEERRFGEIVYAGPEISPLMEGVIRKIQKVAPTRATVLIEGESGAGKEVVAKTIHQRSQRGQAPFIVINTGAIPESLIESELFGHVKGAFTGADRTKEGRIAAAEGGTLFLDEIEAASPQLQVKLLRMLENGEVQRVGEGMPTKVDIRVIAATNQDLWGLVKAGKFREDLYYRLKVFPLSLPSLRERPDDILPLARFYLREAKKRISNSAEVFSVSAA